MLDLNLSIKKVARVEGYYYHFSFKLYTLLLITLLMINKYLQYR